MPYYADPILSVGEVIASAPQNYTDDQLRGAYDDLMSIVVRHTGTDQEAVALAFAGNIADELSYRANGRVDTVNTIDKVAKPLSDAAKSVSDAVGGIAAKIGIGAGALVAVGVLVWLASRRD